jgi:hypothetical protein
LTAASNTDGAIVTIQACAGTTAQQWTFTAGSVKIFGNKCLDVPSGSTTNGNKLQIWTCGANNANQQFYYTVRAASLRRTSGGRLIHLGDRATSISRGRTTASVWICLVEASPTATA